jgi:two-component system chemotaxis response regulator CheB
LEPNTIYFAPPDYHVLVDAGPIVAVSSDEPVHFSRPSIDVLFQAAADLCGPALLGIVLTGASQDGADGLAAIARAGGVTVVQRPDTADSSIMPAAALKAAPGSLSLTLSQIGALLRDLKGAELSEPSAWSSP